MGSIGTWGIKPSGSGYILSFPLGCPRTNTTSRCIWANYGILPLGERMICADLSIDPRSRQGWWVKSSSRSSGGMKLLIQTRGHPPPASGVFFVFSFDRFVTNHVGPGLNIGSNGLPNGHLG